LLAHEGENLKEKNSGTQAAEGDSPSAHVLRRSALTFDPSHPLCENICNGYLYMMTQHLLILKGIYGFEFPKRFFDISSRDLTLLSILII
jgi:hypothetical protein